MAPPLAARHSLRRPSRAPPSRARSRRQGPLPFLRRSRPLHPGGRRGGPRRHPLRVTLHPPPWRPASSRGRGAPPPGRARCGHSGVERRRGWRRRQGWRGGLLKPSSLRGEASGDAAFLRRRASRPAAGGAAAGAAAISPSLSAKSSSARHLSVPELEGLVDLVEGGSGRKKALGGSSNNLEELLTEYARDDSENDQEEMCNEGMQ
ncbi:unnamed protein product [Urochloa humidicola]